MTKTELLDAIDAFPANAQVEVHRDLGLNGANYVIEDVDYDGTTIAITIGD